MKATIRRRVVEGDGDPRHGKANIYTDHACRCPACKAAHTLYRTYQRERRRALPHTAQHGTPNEYREYACRCDACRLAWSEACRRWRQ